jgi:predicted Rossmann fold nucleotide-binding protein DprA/Smf involved in DNA uptake
MPVKQLTEDAKAILLLCGRFGKREEKSDAQPLSNGAYNALARWLVEKKLRPAELISQVDLHNQKDIPVDRKHLAALLTRGAALAFALEQWRGQGIWVICRSDPDYPTRLKSRLKDKAPPILFGVGDRSLLKGGGLDIVGSRDVTEEGEQFTVEVATKCGKEGVAVASGGARGVDETAMLTTLNAGGIVIGLLADGLAKAAVSSKYRRALSDDCALLLSPYHPDARFTVGTAMSRNKLIYAMADYTVVVSCDYNKGGTWAGATEELGRPASSPVFVRTTGNVSNGHAELLKLGARPFPETPWDRPFQNLLTAEGTRTRGSAQLDLVEQIDSKDAPKVMESGASYEVSPASSIYDAVLPVILRNLAPPKTRDELVAELEVRKAQMDDWLKRAIKEDRILKKGRPVKYYAASSSESELPLT